MSRLHFRLLFFLTGLFVFRVVAQMVQATFPNSLLPPFQAWHGAVLPYPMLVAAQIAIVITMAIITFRVRTGAIVPNPWKHRTCFAFGGFYFSFMAFRLFSGFTFLADHPWFSKHLPAFFHMVLAIFVLTLAHYLYRKALAAAPLSSNRGAI